MFLSRCQVLMVVISSKFSRPPYVRRGLLVYLIVQMLIPAYSACKIKTLRSKSLFMTRGNRLFVSERWIGETKKTLGGDNAPPSKILLWRFSSIQVRTKTGFAITIIQI